MEALNKYLKQFPHYHPKVFDDILPFLSVKEIAEEDYFLRHGSVCREIGFVEKGLLRLYYLNDGKEVTNCFCIIMAS